MSVRALTLLLWLLALVTGGVGRPVLALELSDSARSRLFLDKNDAPPKVTPGVWDRPENYSRPEDLMDEVPKAMLDLLGFTPRRLSPPPEVTPRIQGMSQNLVRPGSAPAGLSFARRVTPEGVCRVFVAKETALALDDATFVQWHERAHCDRGYNDRELEESKANIQAFLMMAKTGDVWYAWQSIDSRSQAISRPEPFWVPYKLGYRVGSMVLAPLFKKRGGPQQEFGYEVVSVLKGMSERQVNALAMLLAEDGRNKVGNLYGGMGKGSAPSAEPAKPVGVKKDLPAFDIPDPGPGGFNP